MEPQTPTSEAQLLEVLQKLDARKGAWAALPPRERAALLRSCLKTTAEVCITMSYASYCCFLEASNAIVVI